MSWSGLAHRVRHGRRTRTAAGGGVRRGRHAVAAAAVVAAIAIAPTVLTMAPGTAQAAGRADAAAPAPCAATQLLPSAKTQVAGSTAVLFVHGFVSSADIWNQGSGIPLPTRAALLPGLTSWTFDYSQVAANWVTDPLIGPKLADAISCLAGVTGRPVVVVAHSMGGLATQLAVSRSGPDGTPVAGRVAEVITIGTPFRGSLFQTLAEAGTTAAESAAVLADPVHGLMIVAAFEAMRSACAGAIVKNPAVDPCHDLGLGPTPAGRALMYESAEIQALPPWPAGLPVFTTAGDIQEGLTLGDLSLTVSLGDIPVSVGSGTSAASAGLPFVVPCHNVLLALVLDSDSEPCYHHNLPHNPQIVAAVMTELRKFATSPPHPPASGSAAEQLAGDWYGTYTCAQGLTGLDLRVTRQNDDTLSAVFAFHAVATNPSVPSGTYTMTGTADARSADLTGTAWSNHPPAYVMVDLHGAVGRSGATFTGTVSGPGCTTFSLTRRSSAADPASMVGTWTGSYQCRQVRIALHLAITSPGGNRLAAEYSFGPVPGNPGVPRGSYTMNGTYGPGHVVLTHDRWITRPPGYDMVDLIGTPPPAGTDVFDAFIPGCGSTALLTRSGG